MFLKAKPVYAAGTEKKLNSFAVFSATTGSLDGATIRIAAADFYSLFINGKFVSHGPARTAKGYARVDEIHPADFGGASNRIDIFVAGYNCRSISTVLQPPFLCAEIEKNGQIIAATGENFECRLSEIKKDKTDRYSVQRHFVEQWDLTRSPFETPAEIKIMENAPVFLPRVASYPEYKDIFVSNAASVGDFEVDPGVVPRKNFYSFQPSERWGRYSYEEIENHSYEWITSLAQNKKAGKTPLPMRLKGGEYAIFDLSRIETGFIGLSGVADGKSDFVVAFSEYASTDKFSFTDMHVHNVIDLSADKHFDFISFEPYVMRYVAVFVKSGDVTLSSIGVKSYVRGMRNVTVPDEIKTQSQKEIYEAAVRTFSHNAVDLYTDCPSRERAGWLCDSYFTGKTEYELFGSTQTEDAFLENYRLYKTEGEYPAGVLPMCYPSDDQDNKVFIPQWNMWYILEVEDYINNRQNRDKREKFRKTMEGLLEFFGKYENEDGLLENLPSWNFVEWSRANDWTRDVSYPTNFLYAEVLRAAYRLYGDEKLLNKAEKVARTAVGQSFNGEVFLDHAERKDGKLVRMPHCSEACQYYAVLFGGFDINDEKYSKLKELIVGVFNADRKERLNEIVPVNAFIGAYLRLETLLKMSENELVLKSVEDFFGDMARNSGTLWEYRTVHGSQDHGFASYALVAINKALGISRK